MMHDPMTVAFEIKYPWKQKPSQFFPEGYRDTFITIWHVDPEKDGSDDSCDWFGNKRKLHPQEKAIFEAMDHLETILDNRPMYPDHPAHLRFQPLKQAIWALRKRRGWRIHPRYHFWHYKIQIRPLQAFKRWLFTRCSRCGGRFKYGESCISNQWDGPGPRWFRSEDVYHMNCERPLAREARGHDE